MVVHLCPHTRFIIMNFTLRATVAAADHDERLWHVAWSQNGSFLVTCGEDKAIRVWRLVIDPVGGDTISISLISTIEDVQNRTIRSCEWSPNGKMIASASFDGTVIIWKAQDTSLKFWDQLASLEGHDNEVKSVSWCHDGSYIATCGRDKKVWIWETIVGGEFECVAMLDGHTQDVKFVKWHTNRKILFSCSYDDTIKVWMDDNDEWYCAATLSGHTSTVWGIAIVDDGLRLLSCSDDKSVILWDCIEIEGNSSRSRGAGTSQKWIQSARLADVHSCPIYTIHANHDLSLIATGGGDNSIVLSTIVRESDDGYSSIQVVKTFPQSHDGDVNCVRWSPTIPFVLASVGDDGKLNIWTLES